MEVFDFDVVIIGGGPAGLSASIAITNKIALKVLVIDQLDETHQRIGESCPPELLLLIKQLELTKEFNESSHQRCPGYASIWGHDKVGYNDFIVNPHGQSWRLNRREFDTMLLTKARRNGVLVKWNTRFLSIQQSNNSYEDKTSYALLVKETKSKHVQQVRCKFVIDATGSRSQLAKALNVEKSISDRLVATVCFSQLASTPKGKQVRIESTRKGWWYHTLLPENKAVTMVVTERKYLSQIKLSNFANFEQFVGKTNFVSEHKNKLPVINRKYLVYPITSGRLQKMEGDSWLAIGDAAASYDPIAAQGIFKALKHGIYAGEKVKRYFLDTPENGNSELVFTMQVNKEYEDYWQTRQHLYGLENRWNDESFWQGRNIKTMESGRDSRT